MPSTFDERFSGLPVEVPDYFNTPVAVPNSVGMASELSPQVQLVPVDYNPFPKKRKGPVAFNDEPPKEMIRPEAPVADKMFGLNGVERYQFFPERIARNVYDIASGQVAPYNPSTGEYNVEGAMDVAGLLGGAPLGMKPGTASVASGAARRNANEFKMTAVEHNPFEFTNEVYHGTTKPGFEKFQLPDAGQYMPDRGLGIHVAKDPALAETFVKENGAVYPLKIPDDKKFYEVPQELHPYIEDRATLKNSKNVNSDQNAIDNAIYKVAYEKEPAMFARFLEQRWNMTKDKADEAAKAILEGKSFQNGLIGREDRPIKGLDDYIKFDGVVKSWNETDRAKAIDIFKKDLQDKGYVGVKYINTSPMETAAAKDPTSYVIFDPSKHIQGKYTNTLMSDTQKPGMAIAGLKEPAKPFYSAVEQAVMNIQQPKMTGQQWLGTLSNKPGVKPEELDWIGLKSYLAENADKVVTKQEIQNHVTANKVEIKDVDKGKSQSFSPRYIDSLERTLESFEPSLLKELKTVDDVALAKKHNPNFRETFKDETNEEILAAVEKAKSLPTYDHIIKHYNTREEAEAAIRNANASEHLEIKPHDNFNDTKYQSYQLPGGENYREKLLTLSDDTEKFNKLLSRMNELRMTPNGALSPEYKALEQQTATYKSSHWDEHNVLAHVRMNDRTMSEPGYRITNLKSGNTSKTFPTYDEALTYANGLPESVKKNIQINEGISPKKSLHIEEIQSDWHQQGRQQGYNKEQYSVIDQNGNQRGSFASKDEAQKFLDNAPDFIDKSKSQIKKIENSGVPDAPFKKTWHELVLKRMLREAAEKGYDRLSWTPGEAQAARYDLSKQIKEIHLNDNSSGGVGRPKMEGPFERGMLYAYDHNGKEIIAKHIDHPKELPDIIGKEVADKLLKTEPKEGRSAGLGVRKRLLEGLELKVGGEGMKGFYDQIIPKALEKIGKDHGVKVKTADIPLSTEKATAFKDFEDYMDAKKNGRTQQVHYIDIPQSLKDQAMHKGFPLFSGGMMLSPVDHNPFKGNSNEQ